MKHRKLFEVGGWNIWISEKKGKKSKKRTGLITSINKQGSHCDDRATCVDVCENIGKWKDPPRKWLNPSRENDDKPLGFGRKKICELPGRILVRSCESVSGNPCAELPKRPKTILVCITCVSFTCFPLNLRTNSCQDGAQAVNGMIFFGNYNHFVAIYSLYRNRGCNLQTMVPLAECQQNRQSLVASWCIMNRFSTGARSFWTTEAAVGISVFAGPFQIERPGPVGPICGWPAN